MKDFLICLVVTAIIGIILYPIFDYIWCTLITHSNFKYSIFGDLIEPILFATIITIVLYLPKKKK